jgi:F-type H+-transporting ATPase subunit b
MANVDATHATTGAQGAAPGGAFPPFQANTFAGQLIWFAIAFGLLYYVMSKIALPKVGAVLHNRQQRIAQDLGEAHALRTQSQQAEAAYEKSLADARLSAKTIAQETRDRLAAETDARRKAVEAELASKLAAAETTIRARTEDAMSNVRSIAADAATAIVERLVGRTPDKATLEAALDRAVRS